MHVTFRMVCLTTSLDFIGTTNVSSDKFSVFKDNNIHNRMPPKASGLLAENVFVGDIFWFHAAVL